MDDYKKNIFFFWDKDIPKIYLDHLSELQNMWKTYKIHLITDDYISNYYSVHDPEFGKIYNKISIGAAKADLIRFLVMYEYGGLYLDIMNYPKENFKNMNELFEKLQEKTVYIGSWAPKNISFQVILSKPKSKLILELYDLCKKNLMEQYTEEIINKNSKHYNLVLLTGPILFHDIIVNKQFIDWNTYLKCEENAPENKEYFEKWDCDLLDIEKYFWLWRAGFDNHHGKNMDKHWSLVQSKQNLFMDNENITKNSYTTIITSSYTQSHPSINLILLLLKSLKVTHNGLFENPVIIAQDTNDNDNDEYFTYLRSLQEYISNDKFFRNVSIIMNNSKIQTCLSGNLLNALDFVKTEYIYILQHDFLYIKNININKIIEDMETNKLLKCIRLSDAAVCHENVEEVRKFILNNDYYYFNEILNTNNIKFKGYLISTKDKCSVNIRSGCTWNSFTGWDKHHPSLKEPYDINILGSKIKGTHYNYFQTSLFTDQCFLCTKKYMLENIFNEFSIEKHTKDKRTYFSPEGWMKDIVCKDVRRYGVYVYGYNTNYTQSTCINNDSRNFI
jgi:mannosyltransferase OCH1-like enzyme